MKTAFYDPRPGGVQSRRGVTLKKPGDVRRLLNKLINDVLSGRSQTDVLRAVTYAAATLLKAIETGSLEERITELEKFLNAKKENERR